MTNLEEHASLRAELEAANESIAVLERQLAELRALAVSPWEDGTDSWSQDIAAAHPLAAGTHDEYSIAMHLLRTRRSKGSLLGLITWLIAGAKEDRTRDRRSIQGIVSAITELDAAWSTDCIYVTGGGAKRFLDSIKHCEAALQEWNCSSNEFGRKLREGRG